MTHSDFNNHISWEWGMLIPHPKPAPLVAILTSRSGTTIYQVNVVHLIPHPNVCWTLCLLLSALRPPHPPPGPAEPSGWASASVFSPHSAQTDLSRCRSDYALPSSTTRGLPTAPGLHPRLLWHSVSTGDPVVVPAHCEHFTFLSVGGGGWLIKVFKLVTGESKNIFSLF